MAKILKEAYQLTKIGKTPVMLTYKTVRRINVRVYPDVIEVSAPAEYSEEEVLSFLHSIEGAILNDLKNLQTPLPPIESVLEFKPIQGIPVKVEISSNLKKSRYTFNKKEINIKLPKNCSFEDVLHMYAFVQKQLEGEEIPEAHENPTDPTKDIKEIQLFGKRLKVVYQGDLPEIRLHKGKAIMPLWVKDEINPLAVETELVDRLIEEQLIKYIDKRISHWSKVTGLHPTEYKIRKMKTRWGSCTPKTGKIRFNFFLGVLPKECVDSVIIHELTHLKIGGHQKDFYAFLHKYCPDYDRKDKKLNELGKNLQYIYC